MDNKDNAAIGYTAGHAIVIDEMGELYAVACEEGIFEVGTWVDEELLIPVAELAENVQQEINYWMEERGN